MKEKKDRKLQMFCLDKAFGFMYDEDNLLMASKWIVEGGKIRIFGEDVDLELTKEQKYKFIENFFASPYFDNETKKELKALTFHGDNSDKGDRVKNLCDFSLPDADLKERIWDAVTDMKSEESLQHLETKMQGFFKRQ